MEHTASRIERIRDWLRSDMLVLRWVLLALYLVLMLGLTLIVFAPHDLEIYFWLGGFMLVTQPLFILGAGTINLCRPIRKRRLWMPVLVASFMLMALAAGVWLALGELFYLEQKIGDWFIILFWAIVGGGWVGWGVLLWVYAMRWQRYQALWRLSAALFAGSLLELLAAVPSHLVTSKRPQCLAGLGTMLGIVAGVYVMLFSFGPMIVVLFLRPRYRRERMENTLCAACGYDLTGTLAAGRAECPECGSPIQSSKLKMQS